MQWSRDTTNATSPWPFLQTDLGDHSKAATLVITGLLPSGADLAQDGQRTASSSEPYRELIELELSRGRNVMGIFQDLVDGHGLTGGYQSVRRFVRRSEE